MSKNNFNKLAISAIGVATLAALLWWVPGWTGWLLAAWILVAGGAVYWLASGQSKSCLTEAFLEHLCDNGEVHLDRRCEASGPIGEGFNHFLDTADGQMTEIMRSASRLVPIARELADGYMMIHQKSQMQNQYGNEVANSVRQLEQVRVQVHSQNQAISEAVGSAVRGANDSTNTVQVTASSMQTLADSTDETARQIDALADINTEILAIAQTITEIAESTNLLALNAAIEAARAGEHGRGFAVVADEVRRLSSQTQAATANIRELADSVGRESSKTIAQVRKTRDNAAATQQQMNQATAEIGAIAEAVNRIKGLSDLITDAMGQQEQMAQSASANVNELVELNESVVSENTAHAVSEADLLKLADVIRGKIDVFITTENGWDVSLRPQKRKEAGSPPVSEPSAGDSGDSIELF